MVCWEVKLVPIIRSGAVLGWRFLLDIRYHFVLGHIASERAPLVFARVYKLHSPSQGNVDTYLRFSEMGAFLFRVCYPSISSYIYPEEEPPRLRALHS